MAPPPLVGDAHGNYRVHIVGNSGAGKSTLGKQLAKLLGVPFIPLDTLFWKPGWEESTHEEMRAKVEQRLAECPNGWVVDGNYGRKIGTIVEDSSTDVIWLDPPLALYLPRIIWRTFVRLLGLEEPCSPGCPEIITEVFFSNESIVWWCFKQHRPVRERLTARMAKIGFGVGSDVEGQKMRRLGGWGGELRAWYGEVERMLKRE
ncbi:AAA domain-containing protein [Mycena galopus ATCC 62051]|nr:AAA domain-containing protein [Mycena galopus ATCC 62051]